ncbi:nickel/cobalt ABC transporter permease [Malaciobacter mytili]|uniref:nickel/cobalt ABC transporter permease n=1 Tax=Malaciobacter mytili TaxID=603050 RepID=UPI001D1910EE|nr:nickel/cobalt ABC transporter permease [Malaciobacter mytili]
MKRLFLTIPMLFSITFIAFSLTTFIPSDPAEVALRVNEIIPTAEAIEEIRIELGMDKPFLIRYANWLNDLFHLDLGNSYINNNRTVIGEIARSLPATLTLAFFAFIIVIVVSIPIGVLSAVYKDSYFDKIIRLIVFIATAMPNYWMGLLLMWLFALEFKLLPTSGATSLLHFILPAITLSLNFIALYVRLIRNSMLDKMKEDFVFYLNVRGIKQISIILKHLVKNSLQTSINALGMSIVLLIAGTFVIENIFAIPGIGRLCISSIFNRDYPMIQGYILMMGFLFVFVNLIVDIIQVYLDPRLKKGVKGL